MYSDFPARPRFAADVSLSGLALRPVTQLVEPAMHRPQRMAPFAQQRGQFGFRTLAEFLVTLGQWRKDMREIGLVEQPMQQPFAHERLVVVEHAGCLHQIAWD